jgi:hypothetical protein
MLAVAVSFLIHTAPQGTPPQAQLAGVARSVMFHLLVLPPSAQLVEARIEPESDGSLGARLRYSIEGMPLEVDERLPSGTQAPPAAGRSDLFTLDGYPAVYRTAQSGYSESDSVIWYRPDVTVVVEGMDRANPPMLIDLTLELR